MLRDFERLLPELPIDGEVWSAAFELARRAQLEHFDAGFAHLEKL